MTTTQQRSAAGTSSTYDVDPVHSRVGFGAKHLGINKVRGRFDSFEGIVVEAGSVNTESSMRGDYLRSEFGMPYKESVAGIPIVADVITLELDVEAIKRP
jgi:hypothetical protein